MPTQGFLGDMSIGGVDTDVAKDANLTIEADELDVTQRGDNGLKTKQPGQFDASIEFSLGNEPGNTLWAAIQDAFTGRTTLADVKITDGESSEFFVDFTTMHVMSFSKTQGLDEEQVWSGTLMPAPGCVMTFDFA